MSGQLIFVDNLEWLANEHPPWSAYNTIMSGRFIGLDKHPEAQLVGVGEIWRRLVAK